MKSWAASSCEDSQGARRHLARQQAVREKEAEEIFTEKHLARKMTANVKAAAKRKAATAKNDQDAIFTAKQDISQAKEKKDDKYHNEDEHDLETQSFKN